MMTMRMMGGVTLKYVTFAVAIIFMVVAGSSGRRQLVRGDNANEAEAREFLRRYNEDYAKLANKMVIADWAYNTNLTDENAQASIEASLLLTKFNSESYQESTQFDPAAFSADTVRQLESVGSKTLSDDDMKKLTTIISDMGDIYGTAKVNIGGTEMPLEPDLTNLLGKTDTPEDVRILAWNGWHDSVGSKLKPLYIEYADLKNRLAVERGFADYGAELRDRYGEVPYDETVKELYETMFPLYEQLHAYIRHKLEKHYNITIDGAIPQHLLGDMWGRFWTNLNSIAVPYPDKPSLDVTENLIKQNYTVQRMFETANNFYTSMGLKPLPDTFFNLSMLEKPDDREVVCHATAWDFYDAKDYRIKMCTRIVFDDFLTVHHEMGHIQYFMQYSDQPTVYRDGANDGFHEAVGELMSMCVSTPKHLYAIGLLDDLLTDEEITINYLFSQSLTTVSTLPFHYLNDLWRWKIFSSSPAVPVEDWNTLFWEEAHDLVGVKPPGNGSRPGDVLDGPTIFHVAQDYDMIRYFTRTILQFQFAQTLCDASGYPKDEPLYDCDFYGSLAAGDKLASMLKIGRSKSWPDALEAMTGTREMSSEPIVKYFQPLSDWLTKYNKDNNVVVGWKPVPPATTTTTMTPP